LHLQVDALDDVVAAVLLVNILHFNSCSCHIFRLYALCVNLLLNPIATSTHRGSGVSGMDVGIDVPNDIEIL
jgi:hypothetical protein